MGTTAVIPHRRNRTDQRPYEKEPDKARHLIETVFCTLTQVRALATCSATTTRTTRSAVSLAASAILFIDDTP